MNKEQVLELMNAIPHDLIEETDTQAPAKRRLPKLARNVLIAACLCLALLGTAFAVAEISNMRIIMGHTDVSTDGYTVEFAVDFYPLDSFTQEVTALADPSLHHKYFDNWNELQAFTGIELFHNPVLDGAEPAPEGTPWDQEHPEQETTHLVLLPVFTEDGELKTVQAMSSNLIDGVWVTMFEGIYTERAEGTLYYHAKGSRIINGVPEKVEGDGMHARVNLVCGEGYEVTQETYTTPNGLTATIILTTRPAPKESTMCSAYFLIDGALFQLSAGGSGPDGDLPAPEPSHAMEILKTVLDGFVL